VGATTLRSPKHVRLLVRNEAPGHGFDESARRRGAAYPALDQLGPGGGRLGDAGNSIERRCRDFIEAVDAGDLLDEIGLAVDVGAPARRHHPSAFSAESEAVENLFLLVLSH